MLESVKNWLNSLVSSGDPKLHYVVSLGISIVLGLSVLALTYAECFLPKPVGQALVGVAVEAHGTLDA